MIDAPTEDYLPFEISVVITHRNGNPCVELRASTTNIEVLKQIISCAFHQRPIIVQPKFRDTFRAVASMAEKGIIYKEGDQYYFNI